MVRSEWENFRYWSPNGTEGPTHAIGGHPTCRQSRTPALPLEWRRNIAAFEMSYWAIELIRRLAKAAPLEELHNEIGRLQPGTVALDPEPCGECCQFFIVEGMAQLRILIRGCTQNRATGADGGDMKVRLRDGTPPLAVKYPG